jgi:hypothetical protein
MTDSKEPNKKKSSLEQWKKASLLGKIGIIFIASVIVVALIKTIRQG